MALPFAGLTYMTGLPEQAVGWFGKLGLVVEDGPTELSCMHIASLIASVVWVWHLIHILARRRYMLACMYV